jgi:enterochelin esterase family protein
MQSFANEGLMIPEQVWDSPNVPKTRPEFSPDLKFGEGTGSATPLAWSMAQFIRLASNLKAERNLETPQVVYDRYVQGRKDNAMNSSNLPPQNRSSLSDMCFYDWAYEFVARHDDPTKKLTSSPQVWKCKNSKSLAIFVFHGTTEVKIAGDFTGWTPAKETFADFSNERNVKVIGFEFASDARVEYKLIVDGKWILDPLNPNKVDNGVGGENSFFTMPEYKPTKWDKGEAPTLDEFEITSKDFGSRTIKVYVPQDKPAATAGGTDALPVLYVEDGSDYVNRARAIQIQQNLVKAGKVRPFIMVFIDPKDRMKEYWANDQWADFVANEVVPEIDKRYRTIKNRDDRALLGASLGGVTSIWTALRHPDFFARVGGQSSSFWIDNERVVKALEKLDGTTKFKFYLDDGTLEGPDSSRKAVNILRDKGFDVTYNEAEAGHNWTAWRDRLADAFVALWK